MKRLVLTEGAYDVIASRLPKGRCFIQVEAAVVDRMRTMRRPDEDYSDVILRLIEIEAGQA
jgi:hypothetical protein